MLRLLAEVERGSEYPRSGWELSPDDLPRTQTGDFPLVTSVPFIDMPAAPRRRSGGALTVERLEIGDTFLEFELVEKLGHGSFGRVFLARQSSLAGRLVAVKFASAPDSEKDSLARLQHTNIMPIFSAHKVGGVFAVCMPFFGRTTLADVSQSVRTLTSLPGKGAHLVSTLVDRIGSSTFTTHIERPAPAGKPFQPGLPRGIHPLEHLSGLSYIDAILHIGRGIASGLAHAHQSGLVHRDLKPANILLGDGGQPIILDFNLATEVFPRHRSGDPQGGTLAYMAPEQIVGFHGKKVTPDPRSDVYSLGLILEELMLGRVSYRSTMADGSDRVSRMLELRNRVPASLRRINRAISPSVEAIIHKCLQPDPDRRYQNADSLIEDITRHQEDRPLRWAGNPGIVEPVRKWCRRHPRISSPTGVFSLASTALLLAFAVGSEIRHGQRARQFQADHLAGHDELAAVAARAEEGSMLLTQRGEDPRLLERGRGLVEESLNRLRSLRDSQTVLESERRVLTPDTLAQLADREDELRFQLDRAEPVSFAVPEEDLASMRPILQANSHFSAGRYAKALPVLRQLLQDDPTDASAWMMMGQSAKFLGQPEVAQQAYSTALSLRPRFAPAWLQRGKIAEQLGELLQADNDLKKALELDPKSEDIALRRTIVLLRREKYDEARELIEATIAGTKPTALLLYLSAEIYDRQHNPERAASDRSSARKLPCNDYLSLTYRAGLRMMSDPKVALEDARAAEKLNPDAIEPFQQQAYILADVLKQPKLALEVTERLLKRHPDYLLGRCVRAVYLARSGQGVEAMKLAEGLRESAKTPESQYRIACVYSLASETTPANSRMAVGLLTRSLEKGFGWERLRVDPDLGPIRKLDQYRELIRISESLKKMRSTD